jgi:hypothetical protein
MQGNNGSNNLTDSKRYPFPLKSKNQQQLNVTADLQNSIKTLHVSRKALNGYYFTEYGSTPILK